MKKLVLLPATLICLFIYSLALPPISLAEEKAPINIEADHMTSTEKTNSVLFTGAVDAKQGDVRIRSDEMTVHYTEAGNTKKAEGTGSKKVEKLVCVGKVEVTRGDWLGTGDQMVYLAQSREIILTGNAKAWQDQNMVSGSKIVYYLDEGRSEVVGGPTTATGGSKDKKSSRVNMTIIQK